MYKNRMTTIFDLIFDLDWINKSCTTKNDIMLVLSCKQSANQLIHTSNRADLSLEWLLTQK